MKIGTLGISPEATAGRTPASADGALAELNWRRALEQAQWELAGHDRLAVERPAATHWAASSARQSLPAPASHTDVPVKAADDRSTLARATQSDASSTDANPARSPGDSALGSRSSVPNAASLGSSLHAARALDIDGLKALVERCVQWCARFAEMRWMPVSTHVRIDGHAVGVTLRDVRISEREAQEIHHRLRERLAMLGLELQELTINGHLVTPASAG